MTEEGQLWLSEVTEDLLPEFFTLSAAEEQRRFIPSAEGILARAWVLREQNACCLGILKGKTPVGLILVYDLEEEPACHCLMELLIDARYQRRGYGLWAVKEMIRRYSACHRYPVMELSVDRENTAAISLYQKAGFVDSGYIAPGMPQYRNFIYYF